MAHKTTDYQPWYTSLQVNTHGTNDYGPPQLYSVVVVAHRTTDHLNSIVCLCRQHTAWMKTLWWDKQEVVWLLSWQPWLSRALWWQAWIHNSRDGWHSILYTVPVPVCHHRPDLSWLNPFTADWPNLSRVIPTIRCLAQERLSGAKKIFHCENCHGRFLHQIGQSKHFKSNWTTEQYQYTKTSYCSFLQLKLTVSLNLKELPSS